MVIPLHDDNPTTRRPVVTILLIAVNLFVFAFLQPHDGGSAEARFDYEHAAIPCEISHGTPLTVEEVTTGRCGGLGAQSPEIFSDKNVYLAALVSIFLHGSWLHVLGNMLFLWVFGNNVEDRLGPIGFLVFYLFVGMVATLGHVAADPGATVPLVGASGAIAGVMGACLVFWPRARTSATVGGSGFPATSGARPAAVATAATIAPQPGWRPVAPGNVASTFEARNRAPARTAAAVRSMRP